MLIYAYYAKLNLLPLFGNLSPVFQSLYCCLNLLRTHAVTWMLKTSSTVTICIIGWLIWPVTNWPYLALLWWPTPPCSLAFLQLAPGWGRVEQVLYLLWCPAPHPTPCNGLSPTGRVRVEHRCLHGLPSSAHSHSAGSRSYHSVHSHLK